MASTNKNKADCNNKYLLYLQNSTYKGTLQGVWGGGGENLRNSQASRNIQGRWNSHSSIVCNQGHLIGLLGWRKEKKGWNSQRGKYDRTRKKKGRKEKRKTENKRRTSKSTFTRAKTGDISIACICVAINVGHVSAFPVFVAHYGESVSTPEQKSK